MSKNHPKKAFILGATNCPYYQYAKKLLNEHPDYEIVASYEKQNLDVYKKKLRKVQKNIDRWSYLSTEVKQKFVEMQTSPVVVIPEVNFAGGCDDLILILRPEGI